MSIYDKVVSVDSRAEKGLGFANMLLIAGVHQMRNALILCLVSLVLASCGGGGGGSSAPSTFSITGTISGYSGSIAFDNLSTTLNLTVSTSAPFTIASNLTSPTGYSLTIPNPPPGFDCTVANGGPATATANVSNIVVTCAPWSVTGTISGYVGDVGISNNGGIPFNVTSDLSPTTFMIDAAAAGHTYHVVPSSPTDYACSVANGSGPAVVASVTDVVVHCVRLINTWDPISGTSNLATARRSHTATLLNDHSILVAGGVLDGSLTSTILNSAELLAPSNARTLTSNGLTTARYWHTSTLLVDGSVLVSGGLDGVSATASAERYKPSDNMWHSTLGLNIPRYNHTSTLLDDGTGAVLIVGGFFGVGSLDSTEIFDSGTDSSASILAIPYARDSHTATSFGDGSGRVLVTGGIADLTTVLGDTEIYDPTDPNVWSSPGTLTTPRYNHTATLLPNGKILVVGGRGSANGAPVASAEIFDPSTGLWSSAGTLQTARYGHTATLRDDGTVLITGGIGSVPLNSSELYDAVTGTWLGITSGAMPEARKDFTTTLRTDGTVMVIGGTAKVSNIDTTLDTLVQFSATR